MRKPVSLAVPLSLLAFSLIASAADFNFDGRCDLQLLKDNPDKAWWLEVSGADTADLKGKFIGFPGGDLNDIKDLKIENNQLLWSFENKDRRRDYTAKIAGA